MVIDRFRSVVAFVPRAGNRWRDYPMWGDV